MAFVFTATTLTAQEYPFSLPSTITASLNVDTTIKEEFRNTLIGYNIEGFGTSLQKDFIRLVDPITIRFPHGVWSNFYQWQTDGYQNDSYDNGAHESTLAIYTDRIKGNIGGIASLNKERTDVGKKGFDMMWTYSINFDDGPSCVARAKKDIALGLEVKAIELGNEHFWLNQRALRTATPADYLREATAVSVALKAEFPEIKLSIPLGWRRTQEAYNRSILGNGTYFDAITIHKYLGADPDVPGESNTAYQSLLTAKLELAEDVNWVRNNFAPSKPVWLTEWGVSAGDDVHGAACLGMADAYLYMAENQNIFHRSNWFSFNRVLNAMVVVGSNREPVYPLQKRGYLSVYEIMRGVLKDATLLKSTVTSSTMLTTAKGAVTAVNARAVTKDGETTVVAINLTNKDIVFDLKLDNVSYAGVFKHEALQFDNVGIVQPIDFYASPLSLIKQGSGTITLPPLSISKISLNPNIKPTPTFIKPITNTIIQPGSSIEVEASSNVTASEIANIELFINDISVREITQAPFKWGYTGQMDALLENKSIGDYTLKLVLTTTNGQTSEAISQVKCQNSLILPYGGAARTVPGKIEIEDYDTGGQGLAYSDTTLGNDTSGYRAETDVDLAVGGTGYVSTSIAGDEFTRYTINVAEAGVYHMDINFKTGASTTKPVAAAILNTDLTGATTLFSVSGTISGIINTNGNYVDWTTPSFNLQAGTWVLEFQIPNGGAGPNYDYINLVKEGSLSVNSFEKKQGETLIYPNPNKAGVFYLSKSSSWEVFSMLGTSILYGKGTVVNIASFSKGIYLLKIEGESLKKLIFQ